jgi:hypothetical protein
MNAHSAGIDHNSVVQLSLENHETVLAEKLHPAWQYPWIVEWQPIIDIVDQCRNTEMGKMKKARRSGFSSFHSMEIFLIFDVVGSVT